MLTHCFNPRTYIRYDIKYSSGTSGNGSFNPRTYIRYDLGVAKYTK